MIHESRSYATETKREQGKISCTNFEFYLFIFFLLFETPPLKGAKCTVVLDLWLPLACT